MLLVLLALIVTAFHHVMLPFLVAILLAFLIEPVVSRLSGREVLGRTLPRGAAVLVVYTAVLTVSIGFLTVVAPQLAREIGQLAEAMPEHVRQLRDEKLPVLNERIETFVSRASPVALTDQQVRGAKALVAGAHDRAVLHLLYATGLSSDERALFESGDVVTEFIDTAPTGENVLLRMREEPGGEYSVTLEAEELSFRKDDRGNFILSTERQVAESEYAGSIDLVRALDEALRGVIETSGKAVTDTLAFGQRLIFGIFDAFITLLVTLMVAAFLSIDVPGIKRFIRSLFPKDDQKSVDELMGELNEGLSGVIRGQLIIALVNGGLTWIGLVVFGIKYSFVIAVFAAVLSLIPIFGSIISTIPAVLLGFTQSAFAAFGILIWIIVIHFIEGNILNPKIIGSSAAMHPAVIIFALISGEHSYGIVGAILAVPIASVIQTLFLFFKENRWQHEEIVRIDIVEDSPATESV